MSTRLVSLACLATAALSVAAGADLRVKLAPAKPPEPSPAPAAAAKKTTKPAARKHVVPEALRTPTASRGVLSSRSMPQVVGVRRRGGPPVLPNPDAPAPAPQPQPRPAKAAPVEVNARLGRMRGPVTVHRMPDAGSERVGQVDTGQSVAIVSQWEGWYAVIMGDGSQAYVPQTHVELLPFQVRSVVPTGAEKQQAAAPTLQHVGPETAGWNRALAETVISEARGYEGVRYVWGGNDSRGLDCSGLVKNCFAAAGIGLPRTASQQANVGYDVPFDQLLPGDRLYFSVKRQFDHTGIYIGEGYFIHASSSRKKVTIDHLSTPLYYRSLEAARRI
ncbi:MAG: C40 family peptidase [Armatimonadota bacterium]